MHWLLIALTVVPPGTGEQFNIALRALDKEQGVEIEYTSTKGELRSSVKKSFDANTLRDLRKAWGAPDFDLSKWKNELRCHGAIIWRVESKGTVRTICRSEPLVERLGHFQSTIQVLMRE